MAAYGKENIKNNEFMTFLGISCFNFTIVVPGHTKMNNFDKEIKYSFLYMHILQIFRLLWKSYSSELISCFFFHFSF